MMVPTYDSFLKTLQEQYSMAQKQGLSSIVIIAGELHKKATGEPISRNHRMPVCCQSMYNEFIVSLDKIIYAPPKGKGSKLKIEYQIPRPFKPITSTP